MRRITFIALVASLVPSLQASPSQASFKEEIAPLLQSYCVSCHGFEKSKAGINYEEMLTEEAFRDQPDVMELMLWVIEDEEMPPGDADQPSAHERELLTGWLTHNLMTIRNASPNDPGLVVMPRLNHREYARVIRDLTGVTIDVKAFLPQDSSAGEGFLNVGQAQGMGVGQFEGSLGAAKAVSRHAIPSRSEGLHWSPTPHETGHTKDEVIEAMEAWYLASVDRVLSNVHDDHIRWLRKSNWYAPYLEALWRYRYREELGLGDITLEEIARTGFEKPLLLSTLERLWEVFHWEKSSDPLVKDVIGESHLEQLFARRWHELGPPQDGDLEKRPQRIDALSNYIMRVRRHGGRSSIKSRKRVSRAIQERDYAGGFEGTEYYRIDLSRAKGSHVFLMVSDCADGNEDDFVIWQDGVVIFPDGKRQPWHKIFDPPSDMQGNAVPWGSHPKGDELPPSQIGVHAPKFLRLTVPESARKAELHCSVTLDPNWGMNSSTQNLIDDEPYHDQHWIGRRTLGRDVSPRAKKVDASQVRVRDSLDFEYRPLSFLTDEEEDWLTDVRKDRAAFSWLTQEQAEALNLEWPLPLNHDFYPNWPFQFNFAEDYVPLMDEEQLAAYEQTKRLFLDLANEPSLIERIGRADRVAAREQLTAFLEKAWRGQAEERDVERLLKFYDRSRRDGGSFFTGVRAALVPALLHPKFLFRFGPSGDGEIEPLSSVELASRLSFTFWGTIPDEELLEVARSGGLLDPEVRNAQLERLLADPRSRTLATDFAGIWLQFADFRESVSPDPTRFRRFTESLKESMYEESVMFFHDLFQRDRPITDALFANHTFLNDELARHYGIRSVRGRHMRMVKLDDDLRGGLLGMGSVLTKYSTSLRTSPVQRGAWLTEHVLGVHLPPPPQDVPNISDDERNEAGQSTRKQLEEHRDNPACFKCHDKIDPLGIAMENFDAVGAWRNRDLAGERIDSNGVFVSSGETIKGVAGLKAYLEENQDQFVQNFCRKLVGYALGRPVSVTDQPLIEDMVEAMAANENRPSAAFRAVVNSPQFLNRRSYFPDDSKSK